MGKAVKFLYLNEDDMIKAGVLNAKKCVNTIDEMFHLIGKGDYIMGGVGENEHGLRIYFPVEKRFPNMPVAGPDRRFMAMVAYLGGRFNVCGAKWYGSNIENPKRGLPRSILLVVLNDPETAEPLAVMSANLLSAMRTGAVPAVGAKYLARKDANTAGLIGAGVISKATCLCLAAVMENLKEVKVYDIITEKANNFSKEMSKELGIHVHPVNSIEEAVRNSDFISVATAGSKKPQIKTEWLKEGSVLATQATADLSEDLFLTSHIVFDEFKMHLAWKEEEDKIPPGEEAKKLDFPGSYVFKLLEEGKLKKEDIRSLGPIAAGIQPGRENDKERFVLIIGGLAVEDVAWGFELYQEAKKKGLGQELTLWNEPHWF